MKRKPTPVRLDEDCDVIVTKLAERLGMTKSEIIRRAGRFALPKFASGEVNIAEVVAPAQEPAATH